MCMNKKALIGIGVALGGLLLINPAWGVAALPLLLLAACPLGMFFMMRAMGGSGKSCGTTSNETSEASATGESTEEQIKSLQAQVRELKAAQAASDTTPVLDQPPSTKQL